MAYKLGPQDGAYYLCSCYFSRNIFLLEYKLHVTFTSPDQFWREYREILLSKGCTAELAFQEVLAQVQEEVQRRKNRGKMFLRTKEQVQEEYIQLHPELYTFQEDFLDPAFVDVVRYCRKPDATVAGFLQLPSVTDHGDRVYSFPVFSAHFCELLLTELDNYERSDITKHRPNTMNRHGLVQPDPFHHFHSCAFRLVIDCTIGGNSGKGLAMCDHVLLAELSLDSVFDVLRENYLNHVASLLYPEWVGAGLDSNRAFTVKYALQGDTALSCHFDNAEVTLNVCLGKEFTGGDLLVGGMWKTACKRSDMMQLKHFTGAGILHRGRQMHLAQAIESGERDNLIMWMRSSSVRNKQCPMCEQKPDLIPFQGFGDGFTKGEYPLDTAP